MRILEIMKKFDLREKCALVLSIIAFLIVLGNLIFWNNEIVRTIVWVIVTIVFVLDYLSLVSKYKELGKYLEIVIYEKKELVYSYKQMGKYIKRLNIDELEDIEQRIENELTDIDVKVMHYADSLECKEEK